MGQTTIEWCGHSINPFGMPSFQEQRHDEAIDPFLDTSKFIEVLRRQRPTRYFWCDLTDMFGEWVPDEWIDQCVTVMALTPQHTHLVLTKRAPRLCDYMHTLRHRGGGPRSWWQHISQDWHERLDAHPVRWPLPNLWLGVSVENQATADERIPWLLKTPSALRFISAGPLLEALDLRHVLPGLDWCVAGGESGPQARPCDVQWLRSLKDQCAVTGTAFFCKQLGAKAYQSPTHDGGTGYYLPLKDRKGANMDEWPVDLRVRQMPQVLHA